MLKSSLWILFFIWAVPQYLLGSSNWAEPLFMCLSYYGLKFSQRRPSLALACQVIVANNLVFRRVSRSAANNFKFCALSSLNERQPQLIDHLVKKSCYKQLNWQIKCIFVFGSCNSCIKHFYSSLCFLLLLKKEPLQRSSSSS